MNKITRKFQEKAEILEHTDLGGGKLLVLSSPRIAETAMPGNFVMCNVRNPPDKSHDPLLPRPLSLFGADPSKGIIRLFYRIAGRGTLIMSRLSSGDTLNIIGPLGNSWPQTKGELVLLSGGMGIPPLKFLSDYIKDRSEKSRIHFFYGAKTARELYFTDELKRSGADLHLSTDDGSTGTKANCVDNFISWFDSVYSLKNTGVKTCSEYDLPVIYACGPSGMLAALKDFTVNRGIRAYVSLESIMACGTGVCRGCPKTMNDGRILMTCSDGPVFAADEVDFS